MHLLGVIQHVGELIEGPIVRGGYEKGSEGGDVMEEGVAGGEGGWERIGHLFLGVFLSGGGCCGCKVGVRLRMERELGVKKRHGLADKT